MGRISEGINAESKAKMISVMNNKKEQVQQIKASIKETAQQLANESETLSSFWVGSLVTKLEQYNRELASLEGQIGLLELYSGQKESK